MPDEQQGRSSDQAGPTSTKATETPAERKERLAKAKAEREARNKRMFAMNQRGVPMDEIAETYGMSVTHVARIIKAKAKALRATGEGDDEINRMHQLGMVRLMKQGWANRAIQESVEASNLENETPEPRAFNVMMQILERESKILGLDILTVSGDPDNPITVDGIGVDQALQKMLQVVLVALEPYPPEITKAVLDAITGAGSTADAAAS